MKDLIVKIANLKKCDNMSRLHMRSVISNVPDICGIKYDNKSVDKIEYKDYYRQVVKSIAIWDFVD